MFRNFAARPLLALFCIVSLIAPTAVAGEVIEIDFESFPGPDGIPGTADDIPTPDCELICGPLADEYASLGVEFTASLLSQGDFFPGIPPQNHFLSNTLLEAEFAVPVRSVALESYSVWRVLLQAFDAGGNLLTIDVLDNPRLGELALGTVSVRSEEPIRSLRAVGVRDCDNCDPVINLDDLSFSDRAACLPGSTKLCFDGEPGDRRFEASLRFETVLAGGLEGNARATPLGPVGITKGGVFSFTDPTNPEVVVKVLNGCGINGHYWVFFAATTTVGFELVLEDTRTRLTKTYLNPDLTPAAPVTDTVAFATCP